MKYQFLIKGKNITQKVKYVWNDLLIEELDLLKLQDHIFDFIADDNELCSSLKEISKRNMDYTIKLPTSKKEYLLRVETLINELNYKKNNTYVDSICVLNLINNDKSFASKGSRDYVVNFFTNLQNDIEKCKIMKSFYPNFVKQELESEKNQSLSL